MLFRRAQVHARSSRKSRACACQANANSRPPGISPCVEKRHARRSCTQVMCNSGGDAFPVPLTRSHKDPRSPQERTSASSSQESAAVSDWSFPGKLSSTDTVVVRRRQGRRHSKQQLDCMGRLSLQKQRQALDIFTLRQRFCDIPYRTVLYTFFRLLPAGGRCWHSPCFSPLHATALARTT